VTTTSNNSSKSVMLILLATLVLAMNALAALPALHELLHADANQPNHTCSATLFSHGQVDSVKSEAAIPGPIIFVGTVSFNFFWIPSTAAENLPPGRAPPASSSSQS
jgi:hypothetical protein